MTMIESVPASTGEPSSPLFPELPEGLECLRPALLAGLLEAAEVHLCATYDRLLPGAKDSELLALAAASRAPRFGHVCVDLADPFPDQQIPLADGAHSIGSPEADRSEGVEWPSVDSWRQSLLQGVLANAADEVERNRSAGAQRRASYLAKPLVLDGTSLYLHRMYEYECRVADDLTVRSSFPVPDLSDDLDQTLEALFSTSLVLASGKGGAPESTGEASGRGNLDQAVAARNALLNSLSVITGGPGTGKTTTIARMIVAGILHGVGDRIFIAAPTGKAAQRVKESMRTAVDSLRGNESIPNLDSALDTFAAVEPSTIHRLLKSLPNDRFRRNASDPLEADVVVVDETSMISLWMMSRLLEAVPPTCRLVFVGDPDQLVSIDAGTVLSDLVSSANSPHEATDADRVSAESDTDGAGGSPIPVTRLTVAHRFGGDESLTALFEAARMGNGARFFEVLGQNSAGDSSVRWIQPSIHAELLGELESELAEVGADSVVAARAGDIQSALSAMLDHGVLTSTRGGPGGLYDWTERIERRVVEVLRSRGLEAIVPGDPWYVGRPLMVTRNDLRNGVSNGDVGVVVAAEDDRGNSVRRVAIADKAGPPLEASRLDSLESWWAMTIHKSQGSEFPNVVVSLTRAESRVLSRQLLYTALTRASHKLTIVAERDAIEAALARPVSRGSRLGVRLLAQPNQV